MNNFFIFLSCLIFLFIVSVSFSKCNTPTSDRAKLISQSIQSWSGFEVKFEDNIPEQNLDGLYGDLRLFVKNHNGSDFFGKLILVHYDPTNNKFNFSIHNLSEESSPIAYV